MNTTKHFEDAPSKVLIDDIVLTEYDELLRLRRHFHRNPELSFNEYETAKYISSYIRNISPSIHIITNIAKTGVTALLNGEAGAGPCIALRADMDALPVQEDNEFEYKSNIDGISHCCGHDFHIAILLVTLKVLYSKRASLCGSIKCIFQPAEEDGAGAKYMVDEGVLNKPLVKQIYGLHVSSSIQLGQIEVNMKPKPFTVGCASYHINMTGLGGHGAMPHLSNDVVIASSHLITQIHSIVSRNISPMEMAVVGVGTIQSGYKDNVIADKARISGDIRFFKNEVGDVIKRRLREICQGISVGFGVEVKLEFEYPEYPPLYNTEAEHRVVCEAAKEIIGDGLSSDCDAIPASEDFAYYLERVPGCYFFVGGKLEDGKNRVYAHHVADFKLDERCLLIGCQMFVKIIMNQLSEKRITAKL